MTLLQEMQASICDKDMWKLCLNVQKSSLQTLARAIWEIFNISHMQYERIMDSTVKTGSDVTAIVVAPSVGMESRQLALS